MREIRLSIKELFEAVESLEQIKFVENIEVFQKTKISAKNQNGEWCDVTGLITKKDEISKLTFSSGEILRAANKHLIRPNEDEKCVRVDSLAEGSVIHKADGNVVTVIKIENQPEEVVYDFMIDTDEHLYQDAYGFVHHNTELAKALAEYMFDDDNHMVRIDMSEFQEKHTVSRLVGSPPGYVGFDDGGQFTEPVRRRPYNVVLLDEIEKAHPDVLNVLLQVLDDGRLTDAKGREVNFKNTIIIMTSNIGSHIIKDEFEAADNELSDDLIETIQEGVMEELKDKMRPELLNRIDDILMFNPLDMECIKKIAELQLNIFRKGMEEAEYEVEWTQEAVNFIAKKGYDPQYGARPVKRAVKEWVREPLAKVILEGGVVKQHPIVIGYNNDDKCLSFKNKTPKKQETEEPVGA